MLSKTKPFKEQLIQKWMCRQISKTHVVFPLPPMEHKKRIFKESLCSFFTIPLFNYKTIKTELIIQNF